MEARPGFEPGHKGYEPSVLPLNYLAMVRLVGLEPTIL